MRVVIEMIDGKEHEADFDNCSSLKEVRKCLNGQDESPERTLHLFITTGEVMILNRKYIIRVSPKEKAE